MLEPDESVRAQIYVVLGAANVESEHNVFFHHVGPGFGFFLPLLIARLVFFVVFLVIPWIIGLTYIRTDANRHGQAGWLWALVTFVLGWIAVLAYLIVRAATGNRMLTTPTPPAPPSAL
jgi:hypothetical protein